MTSGSHATIYESRMEVLNVFSISVASQLSSIPRKCTTTAFPVCSIFNEIFFINHLHASRLGRHTDFPTTLLSLAPRTRSNELSEIEHSSSLPIDQNTGQRRRKPIGRYKMSLHYQFQRITRPKSEWTTSRHLKIAEKNPTPGNVRAVQ